MLKFESCVREKGNQTRGYSKIYRSRLRAV